LVSMAKRAEVNTNRKAEHKIRIFTYRIYS